MPIITPETYYSCALQDLYSCSADISQWDWKLLAHKPLAVEASCWYFLSHPSSNSGAPGK